MKPYHLAWLAAHPDRTVEWLQRMLDDGFDVHHLDGNRTNNSPGNLILLEHVDHLRVHGADHLAIPRLEMNRKLAARPWRKVYQHPVGPLLHWREAGIPVKMTQEWWKRWGENIRKTATKNGLRRRGDRKMNGIHKVCVSVAANPLPSPCE